MGPEIRLNALAVVVVVFELIASDKRFAFRTPYEDHLITTVANDNIPYVDGLARLASLSSNVHRGSFSKSNAYRNVGEPIVALTAKATCRDLGNDVTRLCQHAHWLAQN